MNEMKPVSASIPRLANSPKIVGRRLKELLRNNCMKHKEAATLLGVTQSQISNFITGYRELSIKQALILAEQFHVRIEWILNIGDHPDVRDYGGTK